MISQMQGSFAGDSQSSIEISIVSEDSLTKKRRTSRNPFTKAEQWSVKSQMRLKHFARFWPIKVTQLLCVVYILVLTFSPAPIGLVDPATGRIIDVNSEANTRDGVILVNGDYRPVVAQSKFQMVCLALSRMSAFSMYPVMILVFLSKCKATMNFIAQTPLSLYTNQDFHELHNYAGKYIAFDVWIHTIFHLLRWGDQGNISLLWNSECGLTGLLVVVATPLITFPMMYLKTAISYEVRKGLHYLFYLFAIGMCFHVPVSGIPNGGFIGPVLAFCIGLYTLDALYVTMIMTEKIETTIFQVLPSGVQMSMDVSDAFQRRGKEGGFAFVCLPWVDKNQWHAFSLFENPAVPNRREVFMQTTGDWTRCVHDALQRNTVRPIWVQGPFDSPYRNAVLYDNSILVASGIGITPTLSVIRAQKEYRRVNLIWAVRDADMLDFFLERLYLDHDGWNLIFYTGKTPLNPALEKLHTNVRVIKGRPNLKNLIPTIIYGIESGKGLPEKYTSSAAVRVKKVLIQRTHELDEMDELDDGDKWKDLTDLARNHGFLLRSFLGEMDMDLQLKPLCSDETEKVRPMSTKLSEKSPGTESLTKSKSSSSSSSSSTGHFVQVEETSGDGGGGVETVERVDLVPKQFVSGSKSLSSSLSDGLLRNRRSRFSLQLCDMPKLTRFITSAFRPWEDQEAVAKEYVKGLDAKAVLSTWGLLYCGGSKQVEDSLKQISMEYGIELNTESFAW